MRVAFVSGGKESIYALYLVKEVDVGLFLIYDFPRPNPHVTNIHKSIETLTSFNLNIILIKKLMKGKEKEQTIEVLKMLNAKEIIAGDVYIEDHLKYMESIANEVGAKLIEPLWGKDPEELLYKEFEDLQLKALIIGCIEKLGKWLGKTIDSGNLNNFITYVKSLGVDPLGEHGEYHTLVLNTVRHKRYVKYKIVTKEIYNDYYVVKLV